MTIKISEREVTSFKPAYSLSPRAMICVFSKLTGPSWTENTIQQMNCYSAGKCGQSILCYPPDTDLSTPCSMGYWCITFISNSRLTNSQTSLIFIFFCYKGKTSILVWEILMLALMNNLSQWEKNTESLTLWVKAMFCLLHNLLLIATYDKDNVRK